MGILRRLPSALALSALILAPPAAGHAILQTLMESGVDRLVDNSPNRDDPTLLWATTAACHSNPDSAPGYGMPGDEILPALLSRASLSIDRPRPIFSFNPPRPISGCNPYQLLSNIRAVGPYLYFVDNQGPDGHAGLWRVRRDANPGDAPYLLADLRSAVSAATVVEFDTDLAVMMSTPQFDRILQFDRESGQLLAPIADFEDLYTLRDLHFDGRFLYWTSRQTLWRFDTRNRQRVHFGVIGALYPEGYDEYDDAAGHHEFSYIIYSQDNKLYEADTSDTSMNVLLYTSPVAAAQITAIARSGQYYFFVERRPSGPFDADERILRHDVFADRTDLIYGPILGGDFEEFHTDRTWLYFRDAVNESLLRLSNNEAAIQIHELSATGLEITQGLQDAKNDLRLIADKRTIVRFYVRSERAEDVYGVTASLAGSNTRDGFLGRLEPINVGGKLITVRQRPTRTKLGESFQFELPRQWTNGGHLSLVATVNPAERVIEDVVSNNSVSREVDFTPSERLFVVYYNFSYDLAGTRYPPAPADITASRQRMQRLYPLGEYNMAYASPGLHTVTVDLVDNKLTAQVDRSDPDCVKRYEDASDRNMCASDYVHARIAAINQSSGIDADWVSYGNIAQAPSPTDSYFTRGYASGQIASGPSTDANYASHEVGHTLGRQHPSNGSAFCGHTASDDAYPYFLSFIDNWTDDNVETRYAGLDFGTMTYLDASMEYDTMGYCKPNWISDYTYEGMYQYLISPTRPHPRALRPRAAAVGDWLVASGTLTPAENAGGFVLVQRTGSVMDATVPQGHGFTLELRNRTGSVLATYPFAGVAIEDQPGKFAFDLVVAFIPGTAELRVVESATGHVLARHAVSAAPPLIGGVQLVGAPAPVDGTVTVTWTASDPDGDALSFDIFASRNGNPYRPLQLGITGSSVALDTTRLGGGMNTLRVVASDGAQTAYAESGTFTVPPRQPTVVITSPVDGYRADWAQLVSFQAEVDDIQDDDVALISWSGDKAGPIGTGRWVQTDQLPVGENTITVTATNSLGASESAVVKVVIGDALTPPGPTLSVAPQMIAWQVAAEDTTVQTTKLNVDNHGTDTLQFDVSSDSDWLLIDSGHAVTGASAPRSFTIIAYPTMVPSGVTSHATLTLRSTADPNDVVTVPAQLSRGNVFDHTGESVAVCVGDCDGGGDVTIDELIRGVNIALGSDDTSNCEAMDVNADGAVTIDELLRAVNAALQGC